jgi:hypothetical protein
MPGATTHPLSPPEIVVHAIPDDERVWVFEARAPRGADGMPWSRAKWGHSLDLPYGIWQGDLTGCLLAGEIVNPVSRCSCPAAIDDINELKPLW